MLTFNNETLYEGVEKCLLKDPDKELCFNQFLSPKAIIGKNRVLIGEKRDRCYIILMILKILKLLIALA